MKTTTEIADACKTLVERGWTPVKISNLVGFVPPPGRYPDYHFHCDPLSALCCEQRGLSPVELEQFPGASEQELRPAIAARLLGIESGMAQEFINLSHAAPEWEPLFA